MLTGSTIAVIAPMAAGPDENGHTGRMTNVEVEGLSRLTLDLHKIDEWRRAPAGTTRFSRGFVTVMLIAATLYNLFVSARPDAPSSMEIWLNLALIAALLTATATIAVVGVKRHFITWLIAQTITLLFILGCTLNNFWEGGATIRVLLWLPWLIVMYVQNAGVFRPHIALVISSVIFCLSLVALAPYAIYRDLHFGMPEFDVLIAAALLQMTLIAMLYNVATRREMHLASRARAEAELAASEDRARIESELAAARLELAYINRSLTISALAASIAHEIKQPLSAIITSGNASINWLARAEPVVHEAQILNERIIKDASRASEIVISMRDLLQRGKTVRTAVEPRGLVEDIRTIMQSEALAQGAQLTVDYAPDLPAVAADRVQIQQVVINLVLNAIEASHGQPQGARPIRIAVQGEGADAVEFAVEDRGEGLSTESAARLFEAFYTTKPSGMGLGLAICQTIVQAHGGRIAATRLTPRGTRMSFTIPRSSP
ncbi:Adaptive-response sensory-kinase SasA [Alphaproteobacteria bacterium SO-S41]|nr:Adaptive-response sensory-kinase SasA [Alphaproteobacteria bacterium SO-S41]